MSNKQQRKDIISSLPDSILCHILSFLPTNNTVATSILSKRWKPLWLSVSTLNFTNHSTYIETTDLLSRVYSVMISRHNALPIQIFKLKCSRTKDNDSNDITQLITTAIQRGTQTLHLNGRFDFLDMKLASNIFTCRTLTVLKLKYLTIKDLPQMNDKISPIKTLYLDNIFMYDRTKLINFLLLFPILEELQTNGVRLLTCLSPCPRFVPTTEDMIKCLPNLVKAKLSDNEHIPLFLLSKALTTLSIKLTYHYSVHVPIFNNLTQMEIFFDLYWKKNWTEKWMWILEMLQHSSKLQYLIIHDKEKEKPIYIEEKDEWEEPKIVPECLSSHLRTCLYSNFRGNKCEFQFIQYVMSNSKVLSKMTIHSASSLDLKAKHQMLQKLSVFPRGCKLIFE